MTVRILEGSALDVLRTMESESVQVCVTSPPYFQLRDYQCDGQIGLESTPTAFIAALLDVFDEVKRVLRPDGLAFVNLGDSYSGSGKRPTGSNGLWDQRRRQGYIPGEGGDQNGSRNRDGVGAVAGIPQKSLLLIPERFAIGMQERGWWVRSRIAWCKTSAMPESVRDRPTSAWEHIWMFSKNARYFYDADAVRQPLVEMERQQSESRRQARLARPVASVNGNGQRTTAGLYGEATHVMQSNMAGANLRNWWALGPEPSSLEHYAGFPTELPRRCILAGTSEKGACPACGAPWVRSVERAPATYGDLRPGRSGAYIEGKNVRADGKRPHPSDQTWRGRLNQYARTSDTTGWQPSCACPPAEARPCVVLDPFLGSGTTALVADRLGRDAIGIELNPKYADMARKRIESDAPMVSEPVEVERPVQASFLTEAS